LRGAPPARRAATETTGADPLEADEPRFPHGDEVLAGPPLRGATRSVELGPERPYEVLLHERRVLAGHGDVRPRRRRRGAEAVEGPLVAGDPLGEVERAADVERAPVLQHGAVDDGVEEPGHRDDVEP